MPIFPYPSVWTLRLVKGSALTHVELDNNQIYLNQKINDTIGQNIGAGVGVYLNKTVNPDGGLLNFRSICAGTGMTVNTSCASGITFSVDGEFCDLPDGISVQKVKSCDCSTYQILGDCSCGTIGLRNDGITFNPLSPNGYRFPCFDGPAGYRLCTDGSGELAWCVGGSGGTSADTYISSVTLIDDDLCIYRSDGQKWCIEFSGLTPYEYGSAYHSIQPRKDGNYSNAKSSNIGGGSANTIFITAEMSNIGGGQQNLIYSKRGFVGGGQDNVISALPTITTGTTTGETSYTGITYGGHSYSGSCTGFTSGGDITGATFSAYTYSQTAHTGTSITITPYSAVSYNSSHSIIGGGQDNKIYAAQAFIGGGRHNEIHSLEKIIFGGQREYITDYNFASYSATSYTAETSGTTCSGQTYTGFTYTGITDTGYTENTLQYSGVTYKTSYSAIVGGESNKIYGYWSLIGGGSGNTITTASTKSTIIGGEGHKLVAAPFSTILGGTSNKIESIITTATSVNMTSSTIIGGKNNEMYGSFSLIGAGSGNTIMTASTHSTILNGSNNIMTGVTHSLIGGGEINIIKESGSVSIIGGYNNQISGTTLSSIVGGKANKILQAYGSSIVGGYKNDISTVNSSILARYHFIGGGVYNKIIGSNGSYYYNSIVGGYENYVSGSTVSILGGGIQNKIHGVSSGFIGGGTANRLYFASHYGVIVGGRANLASASQLSFIGGGDGNVLSGTYYTNIVGGEDNFIDFSTGINSGWSNIVGGKLNLIKETSYYTSILGGSGNTITLVSSNSGILNGTRNYISGAKNGLLGGGDANSINNADYAFIGGGQDNFVISNSDYSTIIAGSGSTITESLNSTIVGGYYNSTANSSYSNIVGGSHNVLKGNSYVHVGGGQDNTMYAANHSLLGGGKDNTITAATYSVVVGGHENRLLSDNGSFIGGGYSNGITNMHQSFIGSGMSNRIISGGLGGKQNIIVGGLNNKIGTIYASTYDALNFIGGGEHNIMSGSTHYSNIVGGYYNTITGTSQATIVGGYYGKIHFADKALIGGGSYNYISGSTSSSILSGEENKITASTMSFIGSGLQNRILGGDNGSIVGGSKNTTRNSERPFIGGGYVNIVVDGADNSIVGGRDGYISASTYSTVTHGAINTIHDSATSSIGGNTNLIISGTNSSIVSGYRNILYENNQSSFIGGGSENLIYRRDTGGNVGFNVIGGGIQNTISGSVNTIVGGYDNEITSDFYSGSTDLYSNSIIGAGWKNHILKSKNTSIVGGNNNYISGSTNSIIGGGKNNRLTASIGGFMGAGSNNRIIDSAESLIGGGGENYIQHLSHRSSILGGTSSIIQSASTHSIIGGGADNLITSASTHSIIGGGILNLITSAATYSGIFNGSGNTVMAASAVAIGGDGLIAHRTHTTFMNGLDADTDSVAGDKPFKYHGTFADEGLNKVLVDIDGTGNSVWKDIGIIFDDCPVADAWMDGCILYMFLSGSSSGCTGTTITADTCSSFNGSPYRYDGQADNIVPKLPTGVITNAINGAVSPMVTYFNNIAGGFRNSIILQHNTFANAIVNGLYNRLSGTSHYNTMGGYSNYGENISTSFIHGANNYAQSSNGVTLFGTTNKAMSVNYSTITGGKGNQIYNSNNSSIVGGTGNIINSASTWSIIGGGIVNLITSASTHSGIFNGSGNTITKGASHSAIIGSKGRTATDSQTTYVRGLDALTDSDDGTKSFKYHGAFAMPGANKFLKDVSGAGDAQWTDLPLVPSVIGNCPVISAWTQGCILYLFASGSTSGCTGTTFTADTCANIVGPYRWKGGNESISTTLPWTGFHENTIDPTSKYSTVQGGRRNRILDKVSYSSILNGSGNTINNGTWYSAIIGTRDRVARLSETTYLRGSDQSTDGVDGVVRPFKYHGIYAAEGTNKVLTSDVAGNARWTTPPYISWTGDCPIISAHTVGCYLVLTNCTGGTMTADTCNNWNGPYEIGAGFQSIQPVLGSPNASQNYSSIGGGYENYIGPSSSHARIGGGGDNGITGSTHAYLGGGGFNKITHAPSSFLGSGTLNDIQQANNSFLGGGRENSIRTSGTYDGSITLTGGKGNKIGLGATYGGFAFIGGGQNNKIWGNSNYHYYDSIVGGFGNNISGGSVNIIAGGQYNMVRNSGLSMIGGGFVNTITNTSNYASIVGGYENKITWTGVYTHIGGGRKNQIFSSDYSSIVGGLENTILSDMVPLYAGILNGSGNTINHVGAAITGAHGITSNRNWTTFMNGLDVDTNAHGGQQPFKYHGDFANPTLAGQVLTDVDGLGNAVWANPTGGGTSWTGDCAVVSAYTIECILYMQTNCTGDTGGQSILVNGNITYTADTCNTFDGSPYQYGAGNNNIEPKMPFGSNKHHLNGGLNNIAGGTGNIMWINFTNAGCWNSDISGGQGNIMSGSSYSNITNGAYNRIQRTVGGSVVGGWGNKVISRPGSLGQNTFTGIFQGINNTILSHTSSNATNQGSTIIGGESNVMSGATWSSIIGGKENTIVSAYIGTDWIGHSVILGGSGNTVTKTAWSSAIIGGDGLKATRSHTTFMNGLDVDTDSVVGNTYLRYHGVGANNLAVGQVLKSVNAFGDAQWQNDFNPGNDPSCPIVTAYTQGCTLFLVNCTGGTITADTCSSFGAISPYEYRANNSISTVLPIANSTTDNFISPTQAYSNSQGGYSNKINTYGPGQNAIGGGLLNIIGSPNVSYPLGTVAWSNIDGGYNNYITGHADQYYMSIGGGRKNEIRDASYGHIGGGNENIITASTRSFIGGGESNHIKGGSNYSSIVGGVVNYIIDNANSFIGGGSYNEVYFQNSVIGGGSYNKIYAQHSIIGTGAENIVGNVIPGGTTTHAGIFNGSGNTIGRNAQYGTVINGVSNTVEHNYSAIIGGAGLTTDRSNTTFMEGLDVDTNRGPGNAQAFKYHGTFASPLANRVLKSVDNFGNAVWKDLGIPQFSGCPIVSAWTQGCILYLENCTGGTITADTCSTFGDVSPYKYGAGVDSIRPILGSLQTSGTRASIGGGHLNHIVDSHSGRIGGGLYNLISGATGAGIQAGGSNVIRKSHYGHISAGVSNTIGTDTISVYASFIGAGGYNNIIGSYGYNVITGGYNNEIGKTYHTDELGYSNIVGGYKNSIYGEGTLYSSIVGGYQNEISGSTNAFIGGGKDNTIYDGSGTLNYSSIVGGHINKINNSVYSIIGGGFNNYIRTSDNSLIVGGEDNSINFFSDNSLIVGGSGNTIGIINTVEHSSILSGTHNRIGSDAVVEYASIINGKDNTVGHDYSVIIGSQNKTTNRTYTTFTEGLDVDSTRGGSGNAQAFRYHGTFANTGLNRVLTDVDGFGNAVWMDLPILAISACTCPGSGINYITGATELDCTLTLTTTTGDTITIDTCTNYGPYKHGKSLNSIVPRFPSNPGDANTVSLTTSPYSNIGGGRGNTVNNSEGVRIGSGFNNIISSSPTAFIGGGNINQIRSNSDNSFIGGGYGNMVGVGSDDTIVGGFRNTIYGDRSGILGGSGNTVGYNTVLKTHYSSIVGGENNRIQADGPVSHSAILSGRDNVLAHSYSAIIGGRGITSDNTYTTYTNALDVDTDISGGGTRYFKYHGVDANPGINRILTDVDGSGNAVWLPCSVACTGSTVGATGTTKYVDVRDYSANIQQVITHTLQTEDVIVNVWTANKQKVDAEIYYISVNQIGVSVSMDLYDVKTVIIG